MLSSANSRIPTCAHYKFNGDWICKWTALVGVAMHCNALHSSLSVVPNDEIEMGAEPRECC